MCQHKSVLALNLLETSTKRKLGAQKSIRGITPNRNVKGPRRPCHLCFLPLRIQLLRKEWPPGNSHVVRSSSYVQRLGRWKATWVKGDAKQHKALGTRE